MPISDLIEELRLQFERYVQYKQRMDVKAYQTATLSGTITTIFMGFGIFLLSTINFSLDSLWSYFAIGSLIAQIIVTVITIMLCLGSSKLREYYHPIGYEAFYNDQTNEIREGILEQFKSASKEEVQYHFTKEYLHGIKSYQQKNRRQSKELETAQKTFMSSIIMIPIFSVFIIIGKFFIN